MSPGVLAVSGLGLPPCAPNPQLIPSFYKNLKTNMPEIILLTNSDKQKIAKKYCYADKNPQKAPENFKKHKPDFDTILGNIKETNEITQSSQKSFLIQNFQQKLFLKGVFMYYL